MDGTWEGKLKIVASSLSQDSESYKRAAARYEETPFKIIIGGAHPRVYFGDTEVKPSLFQSQIFMTNAVVFASSTGEDREGQWVETWAFVLTLKNVESLSVCFSRMVNNIDIPEEKDFSKFFLFATGELRRSSH